ncbi:thioredoxin family protein [Dyadobacter psychrotolerans]|uniref:Thioredoxin family protein n=1 Tax=Dyadobacter psychrotolerans TaxID=2541721 RepID=A0A4R5DGZ0_9BACT|nr:thioredoxin family protein [Dyadobacter psychrotolerans]TDE12497.1 thioredoxin family protein [Dyadobacter psychrotolerans]
MKNVANLFPLPVTETAYSYADYMFLMQKVVLENRTTGPKQSEDLAFYTKLNLARMQRLNKKVEISEDLKAKVAQINIPQTWYILTEAWCGDAAQNIPVLVAAALPNPLINVKLLLRDENPELMDAYTTNGGRSIPKLISVDEDFNELFTWGPRPAGANELMLQYKANPVQTMKEFVEDIQRWYIADKAQSVQKELTEILEGVFAEK